MSSLTFRVVDHSAEVKAAVESNVKLALSLMGDVVEGHAKELCPVDTGNLRNSITHTGGDNCEYVGTNVEYAATQEFGNFHHTVGQAHYLRDGAQNNVEEIRATAQAALDRI